ncbi:MAG: alkaline phosphatase family protein [Chloroflexota bacterium]|nr:alkaline phosphatase family protein [Chloroflexota bacterium]
MKKYFALAIVPIVLVLWGLFAATQLTSSSFTAFVDYATPYVEKIMPGNPGDPLTPQLIIVVADGLRLDASQQMQNLNALRAKGADRVVRVGQPSLSLPGWTVIGTGAWQEQHGQTTNFDGKLTPMDSIFLAARRSGLSTALTGGESWNTLFKGQIDTVMVEPEPADPHRDVEGVRKQDDAIEADALKMLKEKNPNLLLIHFTAPDNAYHGYGVFSPQGQRAAQDVDARLGRLLQMVDLNKTTIFFTADHGHIDRGGHGGPEEVVLNVEFVAAGKAIKPGKYDRAMQADLAPTAALLLGTSFPTDNQGDPMFDMLDMSTRAQAQRSVDWAQEIADRYTTIATVIGTGTIDHPKLAEARAALSAGDDGAAATAARSDVNATRDRAATLRESRLQQERLARTPLALLFLLPFALYIWLMRKMKWDFKTPLIGAVAYFAAYYALFFVRGYYFSLSMLNEDTDVVRFFAARTIDAIIALAIAAVVVGVLVRGRSKYATVLSTVNAAFFVAAIIWLQVTLFYWLYGFTWSWFIPDLTWGFKYYLDLLQTGAFMVKSPPIPTIILLPLIAIGAKWIAERFPTRPPIT